MFSKLKSWTISNSLELYITLLCGLMLLIIAIPYSIVIIGPGFEGVIWNRLFSGTNLTRSYPEGTRLIVPWDKMYLYDMRLREMHADFNAITENGVSVTVEVAFRFRPKPSNLAKLHKYIGQDYLKVLVLPMIGSHIRELVSSYAPEKLYSVQRKAIENQLLLNVRGDTSNIDVATDPAEKQRLMQYVIFENIFITNVVLPDRVVRAIEEKEAVKQKALAYDHQLEIARKEKIRKKIEAEGIRDFQNTINQGISDKYLTWKGIEATLELAESDNAKVVVIGSAKGGLPLILGSSYTADAQPPPTPTTFLATAALQNNVNQAKQVSRLAKKEASLTTQLSPQRP
jgi:prohibitin 1